MGSLYRSELMARCQLFMQSESAFACLVELGELGLVQLIDLNPEINVFQRRFVSEIRRCEEMERKLRFLKKELIINRVDIPRLDVNPPMDNSLKEIGQIQTTLERMEREILDINTNARSLKQNFLGLKEFKHVLLKADGFFSEWGDQHGAQQQTHQQSSFRRISVVGLSTATGGESSAATTIELALPDEAIDLLTDDTTVRGAHQPISLGFATGVISRERLLSFERLLWRACRGNVFIKHSEIEEPLEDPDTGDTIHKSVFLIMFQGQKLKSKVTKICDGFRATLHPCPETHEERRKRADAVQSQIADIDIVLGQTNNHRRHVLKGVSQDIMCWFSKVQKMKAVYHAMNQFRSDLGGHCMIGECWCPVDDMEKIREALQRGMEASQSGYPSILNRIETKKSPPTFNRTNKFTEVFQGVVDSYGIATYREVNPAPFAIVSFPFLFSLMFGDAGHGVLMLAAAVWMVVAERQLMKNKSDNEIWNIFFGGRYIILLMGAFSIYAGVMYNDTFSKSLNVFGSAWFASPERFDRHALSHHHDFVLDPTNNTDMPGNIYPFGLDPIWMMAENKISYLNSFKMKLSVIFGVSQMMFGVSLSLMNHKYFRDPVGIFCEFLPQMIFLLCMFGYLIVLIFYKWVTVDATMASCAPSLLIGLINMFLYNYPTEPCSATEFYPRQKEFQSFLLLLLAVCVPWLLLAKPLILRRQHANRTRKRNKLTTPTGDATVLEEAGLLNKSVSTSATPDTSHSEHEEFEFGEIFVHQCIHTIEYCLGCISHTASYLRLWALSLAHAELSEVLWKMVFHIGLTFDGYIGVVAIFVLFAPWACLTVAILLLMEGLSAFLHTLRLHWVEFQSKFYKGEGYAFEPFAFRRQERNDEVTDGNANSSKNNR